ncbi:MAG: hypothetical protein LBI99_01440, partial [Propionibacteriaceae bacterium]|nr:hypothetical protein [Propionibacteriaceae bacterium]
TQAYLVPLGIGAVLKTTWATFRAQPKQFIVIGGTTSALLVLLSVLSVVPLLENVQTAIFAMDFESLIMSLPLLVGGIAVVCSLVEIVGSVMISGVADGVGRGVRRGYPELLQRGLRAVPKAIIWVLLASAASALLTAVFGAWLKTVVESTIDSDIRAATTSLLLGTLAMLFGSLVLSVAVYLFTVRLFLLCPIYYLEEASGLAALKRAWSLSKGASPRILLTLLIVSFAVGLASQVCTFPIMLVGVNSYSSVTELLLQNLGMVIFVLLAIFVLDAISRMALSIASVVFYHDQIRLGKPAQ